MTVTLADLMITAAARAWETDPELLANGIGTLPRLAAGVAKLTLNDRLLLTDGEAFAVEDPVPLGPATPDRPGACGWIPYARMFDILWTGRRHAMVTPVQIDRWGQSNISALGSHATPKVQMLGVRGFPGNSICHANSMLVTSHDTRCFVAGEVDVVCSAGHKPERWPDGAVRPDIRIPRIVTPLCVMDFETPDHSAQVISLHPGVSFEQVQGATGFPLIAAPDLGVTPVPTATEMSVITRLDPTGLRLNTLRENPQIAA